MPFFRLCSSDPLMTTLVDTFGANALRIPDTRLQPMGLLAYQNGEASWWGDLEDVLVGGRLDLPDADSRGEGPVPQLEGTWSQETSAKVGFNILSGFLSAFGIPGGEVEARTRGVTSVAFAFLNVRRKWVKVADVGRAVGRKRIDPSGAATKIFFQEDPYFPLLITDVITCNQFAIDVGRSATRAASLDVDAIKSYVGELKVDVAIKASSKTRMTFEGPDMLTFAYTCYPLLVESSGAFSIGGGSVLAPVLGIIEGGEHSDEPSPFLLGESPGLVELL